VTALIVSAALVAVVASQVLGDIRSERPETRIPSPPPPAAYAAIAGTYTATIEPHSYGLTASGMVGSWSLDLRSNGVLRFSAPPGFAVPTLPASFEIHGARFQTNAFSASGCNGTNGTYRWGLSTIHLRFTKIADPCPLREALLGARQWDMLTPASTAASASDATPVIPDDGSALVPGAYATAFQPQVGFSVGPGWTGNSDTSDWIDIRRGPSDFAGALDFVHIRNVFDPMTQRTIPLPQDLSRWFTSHPAIRVLSPPRSTTLGGVPATQFDVELAPSWICGRPACVSFAPFLGWSPDGAPKLRCRMFVLNVHGAAVVVTITSARGRFRRSVRAAENILSTAEFG
jgi:hypothetical protein